MDADETAPTLIHMRWAPIARMVSMLIVCTVWWAPLSLKVTGWTAQIVQHPPKPRVVWAPVDAVIDWDAILPPPGF